LLSVGKHSMGAVRNDDRDDWREAWTLFSGDIAYVWHSGLPAGPWITTLGLGPDVIR